MTVQEQSELEAAGWERRFEADVARATEVAELYSDLGYEVTTTAIAPEEIGPECAGCALVACRRYVVVYTRRPEHAASREVQVVQ
ncbi:MAG: hypothetical protein ACYCUF_11635 [Acidimicrobiales bacterium]